MTTLRPFSMCDILKFNNINLDFFTETYNVGFYGRYLAKWPDCCKVAESSSGKMQGYVIGKVEGDKEDLLKKNWHGHVSAVTVAPEFRRQGLASSLMKLLEDVTDLKHTGYFVDLFVNVNNTVAIVMYERMGYSLYRRIRNYYSGIADAYGKK